MASGIYEVTEKFEKAICDYTGASYAITIDNQSNALFLSLMYEDIRGKEITIPSRTYPSVPCSIIHAGGFVKFEDVEGRTLKGAYQLKGSRTWDAALRFTHNMYIAGMFMCCSFTGAYKPLKLGKGGVILTDSYEAMLWFKRARYSGRRECSYHDDNFDMIGGNYYLMPEIAARGLVLMGQCYDGITGLPKNIPDVELPYPDLSKFPIYTDRTIDAWGRKIKT